MILDRLLARSRSNRREHLFRLFGYGSVVVLLGFLVFSFIYESSHWSQTTGAMLSDVVSVVVASGLTTLIVLSWFQTEEETSGQVVPALIKLWPLLALCLPSLLSFVLVFDLRPTVRLIPPRLDVFCLVWFLVVAPTATLLAIIVFVRRMRKRGVALLPAFLAYAVLTASVLANLFALVGLIFSMTTPM